MNRTTFQAGALRCLVLVSFCSHFITPGQTCSGSVDVMIQHKEQRGFDFWCCPWNSIKSFFGGLNFSPWGISDLFFNSTHLEKKPTWKSPCMELLNNIYYVLLPLFGFFNGFETPTWSITSETLFLVYTITSEKCTEQSNQIILGFRSMLEVLL